MQSSLRTQSSLENGSKRKAEALAREDAHSLSRVAIISRAESHSLKRRLTAELDSHHSHGHASDKTAAARLPPFGCHVISSPLHNNEDYHQAQLLPVDGHEPLSFFAVYDGHGGEHAAKHCAAVLHSHLKQALLHRSSDSEVSVEKALQEAFVATDKDLQHEPVMAATGSTAVVAVVSHTHIWLAHVGKHAYPCTRGAGQLPTY